MAAKAYLSFHGPFHFLKIHTSVLKISLITQQFLQVGMLAHALSLLDPVFWVLWGPLGSNPKFESTGVTAYTRCYACPNFVPLAVLVPEIMRLK